MKNSQRISGPYVDLTSDAGFKAVYCDHANKDVLIGLLNLFLPSSRQIADLEYLDRDIDPVFLGNKGARLDLHCRSSSGEEFIVEMQKRPFDNFFSRCVSYAGRVYADNLRTGGSYNILPVHIISILDARMEGQAFEDDAGRLRLDYVFREKDTGHLAEDTIMCTFALLYNLDDGKGKDILRSGSPLERYMYYFKNMVHLPEDADEPGDPGMRRLRQAARIASFDREKKEQYERDMGIEFEERLANEYAIRKATQAGIEMGLEEGLNEGRNQGREEGKLETARKMKELNLPMDTICTVTGLAPEQIAAL